jgi:hypothetical protein
MNKKIITILILALSLGLFFSVFAQSRLKANKRIGNYPQNEEMLEKINELTEKVNKLNQELKKLSSQIEEVKKKEKSKIAKSQKEKTKEDKITKESPKKEIICEKKEGTQPSQNKVIFNEIAWMGSENSFNKEWIELKNISKETVDLAGWQILNRDQKIKIVFEKGEKIEPNSFYLLERNEDNSVFKEKADKIYKGAIKNSEESLYLFDQNCQLQDEIIADPDWPAGDNKTKRTMERKEDLTWQTSENPGGTPKKENSKGYKEISLEPEKKTEKNSQQTQKSPEIQPEISLSFFKETPVNEEIELEVFLSNLKESLYDLKISIEKDGTILSEIYNKKEEKWQFSFYYLKEVFFGSSFNGKFKLRIKKDFQDFRGSAKILVKVRESGKSQYFEFKDEIKITEPQILTEKIAEETSTEILQTTEKKENSENNNVALEIREEIENQVEIETENSSSSENEVVPPPSISNNLILNEFFDEGWEGQETAGNPLYWNWGKRGGLEISNPPLIEGKKSFYHEPYSSSYDLTQLGKSLKAGKTYFAEIWIMGTGKVKLGIDHSSKTEWLDPNYTTLNNSPWLKLNFSVTPTQDTENGGLRIRMMRLEKTGEKLIIGAAWLSETPPLKNWLQK